MAIQLVLVTLILGALVAYLYITRNSKYWQKRGIPTAVGDFPGVGHMWMLCTMAISDFSRKIYTENKKHSMVGLYNFTSPSLMIIEPQMVKTVMQSNFGSFHENGLKMDPELDPLTALNPFFLYGEKWTMVRKRLTYAFSSMRLKILHESVKPVCAMLEDFLDKKLKQSGKAVEIEMKNTCSRFTAQVVAAAAFGVDGFCFDEEKRDMSFLTIGESIMEPTLPNRLMFGLVFLIPSLNKLLRLSFVPQKINQFFKTLVAESIEQRRTDTIPRNDFLHLMVELERTEGDKFDIDMIASAAFSFVLDGYETSSTMLSFMNFHLAAHPEVQDKLRDEVLSVLSKYDGAITYDTLKDMTYMDQVMNESMRIMPAGGFLTKRCTEEFELKGSDGLSCRVQPGTEILIPIQGLHEDPRYWENPDVYDPDRFSPERKQSIQKFTFLPFGEGPRMCVGMRMAQLQMKAYLATVLRKYSLMSSSKTQLPLKMVVGSFLPAVQNGIWVKLQKI